MNNRINELRTQIRKLRINMLEAQTLMAEQIVRFARQSRNFAGGSPPQLWTVQLPRSISG